MTKPKGLKPKLVHPTSTDYNRVKQTLASRQKLLPANAMATLQSTLVHYLRRTPMPETELEMARKVLDGEI